jgi:hypothetical protein
VKPTIELSGTVEILNDIPQLLETNGLRASKARAAFWDLSFIGD